MWFHHPRPGVFSQAGRTLATQGGQRARRNGGLAERWVPGRLYLETVSETVEVCVVGPLVAVTTSVNAPVFAPLLTVRRDDPALSDGGVSTAVGPLGLMLTPRVTIPLNPPLGAIDSV